MADYEQSIIKHNDHLLLDQPLLRLPNELLRKNFRNAHFVIEKDTTTLKTLLKASATAAVSGQASKEDILKNIDAMLARMRGIKRKVAACADEEARLHAHTGARISHLQDLYRIQSVDDVRYEQWSCRRLDRLISDHMLRHGYHQSAEELANDRGMRELVDVETYVSMNKIRESLLKGSVTEALAWCNENKKELRRTESKFEFMLRFQQYIELVRTEDEAKLVEALAHAKKHLVPYRSSFPKEVSQVCGLLAFPPTGPIHTPPYIPYGDLYRPSRWVELADLFTKTHNSLLGLPSAPLLDIALSSGLSALKTPACHSPHVLGLGADLSASLSHKHGVCPICSTELNELARKVPYAHHTKSSVVQDPMVLPNGNVYSKHRLEEQAEKAGVAPHSVIDLRTSQVFPTNSLKKLYIT